MTSHMGLVVARPGLVRDALQAVLSAVPGVHALEPADSAASALERLESHSVCLAILDASLQDDALRTTLGAIKETRPNVWCIVISGNPQQGRDMQAAGADGVFVEGFAAPRLSEMIKEVIDAADSPVAGAGAQDEGNHDHSSR